MERVGRATQKVKRQGSERVSVATNEFQSQRWEGANARAELSLTRDLSNFSTLQVVSFSQQMSTIVLHCAKRRYNRCSDDNAYL